MLVPESALEAFAVKLISSFFAALSWKIQSLEGIDPYGVISTDIG